MGLARSLLLKRIRNDLKELEEALGLPPITFPDTAPFPLGFSVHVKNTPGFSALDVGITDHKFTVYLSEDYPYERPTVKWKTEIFHPNIMPPSEGGRVCVRVLDAWDFNSGLNGFIQTLTDLVKNPNPYDPLGSPTCEAASEWFMNRM